MACLVRRASAAAFGSADAGTVAHFVSGVTNALAIRTGGVRAAANAGTRVGVASYTFRAGVVFLTSQRTAGLAGNVTVRIGFTFDTTVTGVVCLTSVNALFRRDHTVRPHLTSLEL